MVRHAIQAQDKAARRASILAAARALFLHAPDRLPSVAMIAQAAGLAKGTAYLYFRTKEEIFLALLNQEWGGVIALVQHAFRADKRAKGRKVAEFLDGYADYLRAHPELLKLEALRYSVLERNLAPGLLYAFKQEFTAALEQAGQAVEIALSLPAGQGVRLLMHSYALTVGLWQALDNPETYRKPENALRSVLAGLDFQTELPTALAQYWLGLKPAR